MVHVAFYRGDSCSRGHASCISDTAVLRLAVRVSFSALLPHLLWSWLVWFVPVLCRLEVYEVWRTVQRKSHVSCSCSWVYEGKHDAGKGDRAILSWQLRVLALESFMFKFVLFLFYLFIQNIKLPLTYFHTSCRMLVLTCKHDVFRKLYNCTPYQSFWSPPKKVCW